MAFPPPEWIAEQAALAAAAGAPTAPQATGAPEAVPVTPSEAPWAWAPEAWGDAPEPDYAADLLDPPDVDAGLEGDGVRQIVGDQPLSDAEVLSGGEMPGIMPGEADPDPFQSVFRPASVRAEQPIPPDWGLQPPTPDLSDAFSEQPWTQADEVAALEAMSPEDQATQAVIREGERADAVAERRAQLAQQNADRAEANYAAWQDAQASAREEHQSIVEEAKALGEQRIDNDRWWSTRSTGQKIAGFVGAILGGYVNPGGRNSGVELIQQQIDQDIKTQVANLGHQRDALGMRRGLVGDLMKMGADEFQAAETARLAALEGVDAELANVAQLYDPMGTQAQRITQARQQVRQQIASQQAALEQQTWQRHRESHAMAMKESDIAEKRRSARAQEGIARARLRDAREARAMAAQRAEQAAQSTASKEQQEKVEKRGVGGLVQKDGAPFIARTSEQAEKIADRGSNAQILVNALDRMAEIRSQEGWQSDTVKSAEYRRAKQLASKAFLVGKDQFQLGVLAGPDMGLLEEWLGGDATELRPGVASAMGTAREGVVEDYNIMLRSNQYTGEPITFEAPQDVQLREQEAVRSAADAEAVLSTGATVEQLEVDKVRFNEEQRRLGRPELSDAEYYARRKQEAADIRTRVAADAESGHPMSESAIKARRDLIKQRGAKISGPLGGGQ